MNQIGCSPIRNFYRGNQVRSAPFVYIDKSKNSFVFVCENYEKGRFLLGLKDLKSTSNGRFSNYSDEVELWHSYVPGGINYLTKKVSGRWLDVNKDLFSQEGIELDNDIVYPVITIGDGEETTYLICHAGLWLMGNDHVSGSNW